MRKPEPLWAFAMLCGALVCLASASPAHAFEYGSGGYGSGAYNVGAGEATTITLASSANPAISGNSITLTATFTPSTATGTITFRNGVDVIGTAALGNGSGRLVTSSLAAGTHSLTALYAGSARYAPSTSDTLLQTVSAPPASSASSSSASSSSSAAGAAGGGGGRRSLPGVSLSPPSNRSSSADSLARSGSSGSERSTRRTAFRDVPATEWFAPYVARLVARGIVEGYKDVRGQRTGLFGPGNGVTYAELAKMAVSAAGKAEETTTAPHNRSARRHWSERYVATAERYGFSAYTPHLAVDEGATRGAVIQTLLEAFGVPLEDGAVGYRDLRASHPHARAINTATRLGFVSGDTDRSGNPVGTIRPDAAINRAEIAKIIVRLLDFNEE